MDSWKALEKETWRGMRHGGAGGRFPPQKLSKTEHADLPQTSPPYLL